MARWRVEVNWEREFEADDEGDALCQADREFSLMSEARATNMEDEDDDQS